MSAFPEDDFTRAMLELYSRAVRVCTVYATRFHGMLIDRGGVSTATRLLSTRPDHLLPALRDVGECGRLHLSLEWLVLQPLHRGLFSQDQRQTACKRLKRLNPDLNLPEV